MGGSNSIVNPMGNNFLGTGGTSLNKPLSFISPLNPRFLGGGMTGRIGRDAMSMGLGEFTQKNPFGVPGNPLAAVFGNGDPSAPNPYVGGPFSLDPNQVIGDKAAIQSEGQKQYQDTLSSIDTNTDAQGKYAGQLLERQLPGIYESLNARHLLNSSALPTEIATQANQSAQDVAAQAAQAKFGALGAKQGFDTGALQRGLSLEDFVNQANVSKSIGAAFAPQAPTGKQNFATTAQGVGALAPIAKLAIK